MKLCPTCQLCFEDEDLSCGQAGHAPLVFKRAGTRLINNRYRIDKLLGSGGMGAVYRGTHIELNHLMAIKLLLPDSAEADPYGRQRLRREALTACRLNHPNLVRVHDCGTNEVVIEDEDGPRRYDELYVVMELLDGQTLRDHLRQVGRLPIKQAVEIARQVASGLAELHSKGIVHRDLKPSNIMLTRDYKGDLLVKIVDFGAVKFIRRSSAPDDVDLTGTMMVGSARYMAPENCRGEALDERSDIYCLALITYEMIAGRHPFNACDRVHLIYQHAYVDPPSLDEVCDDVPARLARLVESSLAKLPEARPQSAAEFAQALLDFESSCDASQGVEDDSSGIRQFGRAGAVEAFDAGESAADEETQVAGPPIADRAGLGDNTSYGSSSNGHTTVNRPELNDGVVDDSRDSASRYLPGPAARGEESVGATEDAVHTGAINSTPAKPREARRMAFGLIYFIAFIAAAAFFTWSFLSKGPSTAAGAVSSAANNASARMAASEVGDELLATTDINIRSEPSLKGEKVGLAEKGSRVRVISESGNWCEVIVLEHGRPKNDEASEDQGWLDGALLRPPEE